MREQPVPHATGIRRSPQQGVDAGQTRRLASADLFGAGTEVRIRHGSDEYRLRITRQGKLILTK